MRIFSSHLQLKVGEGTPKPKAKVLGDSDLTLKTTQENNPTLIHLSPNQVRRKNNKDYSPVTYSQKSGSKIEQMTFSPTRPNQPRPRLHLWSSSAQVKSETVKLWATPPKTQIGFTFGLESGTGTGCVSE